MKSRTACHPILLILVIALFGLLLLQCSDDPPTVPDSDDPLDTTVIPLYLVGTWRLDSICDSDYQNCYEPDTLNDTIYMQLHPDGTYCPHNQDLNETCTTAWMLPVVDGGPISFRIASIDGDFEIVSLHDGRMTLAHWPTDYTYRFEYYHLVD